MSFSVPEPFLSDQGKPCIELDEKKSLFVRVVNHIGRQWPEHDVVGYLYAFSLHAWNRNTTADRRRMLDAVSDRLFDLAREDRLTVLGMGPIMLLPLGNVVPADEDLAALTRVRPDAELPLIANDRTGGVRALYQRAHVISPLTTGP